MSKITPEASATHKLPIWRRLSVRVTALLSLAVAGLLVGTLIGVSLEARNGLMQAQGTQVFSVASLFAATSQIPVAFDDAEMAQSGLDRLAPNLPGLLRVSVSGAEDAELASWQSEPVPQATTLSLPFLEPIGESWTEDAEIAGPGGQGQIGHVQVAFSNAELAKVEAQLAQLVFSLMAIGVLAVLLMARWLTRALGPLRPLTAAAHAVAGGDYSVPLPSGSDDEIGVLAGVFSKMASQVQRREQLIQEKNREMQVVMDNVEQGLVTVDSEGRVVGESSAVFPQWFPKAAQGAPIWEVMQPFSQDTSDWLEVGWESLQDGLMPMELLLDQLPSISTDGERHYELAYTPIMEGETLKQMLIVVSDVSERVQREREATIQRELLDIFQRSRVDPQGLLGFVEEVDALISALEQQPPLVEVLRHLHTIKGNTGIWGLLSFSHTCHELETQVAETASLDLQRLETFVSAWSEQKARLSPFLGEKSEGIVLSPAEHEDFLRQLQAGTNPRELLPIAAAWSLQPANTNLQRLKVQALHLASELGKDLQVELRGGELRLPRKDLQPLWASLIHVLRNALDHGVEPPAERASAGKPAVATLRFSLSETETGMMLELADDGRGINWDKIRVKAQEAGLPHRSHGDLVAALFASGVSSREEVSVLSGRGVGMDAVLGACRSLGGDIQVLTEPGVGTRFQLSIPNCQLQRSAA